jgi:hypothetical protein
MKTSITLSILGIAILVTGCASAPPLILDRVGPAPQASNATSNDAGCLVVYSAWSPLMNLVDPDTPLHSDYTILSSDGTVYRKVRNSVSKVLSDPAPVSLPAGTYLVEADAAGHGSVRVPVLIKARETTTVSLDGDPSPGFDRVSKRSVVSLDDGSVVGWRAN